jgi:hypothetical protein
MKRNNDYHYSAITSFEDIHLEKTRLILKSKLLESKINMDIIQIRETLSVTTLVLTIVRKFIPPDIYEIIDGFFNKI